MSIHHRMEAHERLQTSDPVRRVGLSDTPLGRELANSGVRFVAVGGPLEQRWHDALAELAQCVRPIGSSAPVLNEGGPYDGCWVESTGTINVEVLARFAPNIANDTLRLFAEHQREDGMIPYKIVQGGAGFSQIQIVTPLARVVWRQYLRTRDLEFLRTMFRAMERHDAWLARYRDTRQTGAVEAFCAFDTGHDLSPRFWFAPDRSFTGDATLYDPEATGVPYIAPDLTANVACQRTYLGLIAEELGEDARQWTAAAGRSRAALYAQCFDEVDQIFYDRDVSGSFVTVASDVLARVLACEIGDEAFFVQSLRRYLMNTTKFLAHYGFTTIAMDDPRFDHDSSRNSWGGPVNFLAQLRAPEAFELHGHSAELALVSAPVLAALATADRFPQCMDPWSGEAGFTEVYSPSILWYLDTLERHSGVMERPDGDLWFSGLAPTRLGHGAAAQAIGVSRTVRGVAWELIADDDVVDVFRDSELAFSFPRGWRVITDGDGTVRDVCGLSSARTIGTLRVGSSEIQLSLEPNEVVQIVAGRVSQRRGVDFVRPVF